MDLNGGGLGSDASLDYLIAALAASSPATRIDLRDPILLHGAACIPPLVEIAVAQPEVGSSVAAWLEVLTKREIATRPDVVTGLRRIARGPNGEIARGALARLGASESSSRDGSGSAPRVRTAPEAAVHARVRQAAREGRLIAYGELETSRGHVGTYLLHLGQDEAAAGHPPITSIVVGKATMRPGDGYLPAMIEVGYSRRGETLDEVWGRAVAEVFAFWSARPTE